MIRSRYILMILAVLIFIGGYMSVSYALPDDAWAIKNASIGGSVGGWGDPIEAVQSLAFRIFALGKIFISWLALIFMVMIGANMVVFSRDEEKIKTQKKQITYSLVGFLFLNIPGMLYQIFFSTPKNTQTIAWGQPGGWSEFFGGIFWDDTILWGFMADIIGFLQVFIFGVAIIMFTWGLFRLIISGGDEEVLKSAKNRIIYGVLALLFMAFVRFWGPVIANGDLVWEFSTTAQKLFGLAFLFAGPIAIFFLIWGGYYYITSGGDEERIKKGKNIIVNTFIATLILIAGYSFMADLIKFIG